MAGWTLVGIDHEIGTFGNCFVAELDNGHTAAVTNIGKESLDATGVEAPWEVEIEEDGVRCRVVDERVPAAAFRTSRCFCHGGVR